MLDRLLGRIAPALESVRLLAQSRRLGLRRLERGVVQVGAQMLRLLLGKLLRLRLVLQRFLGLARLLSRLLRGFFRSLLAALRDDECGGCTLGVVQLGLRNARVMLRVLERTLGFVYGNDRQALPEGTRLGIGRRIVAFCGLTRVLDLRQRRHGALVRRLGFGKQLRGTRRLVAALLRIGFRAFCGCNAIARLHKNLRYVLLAAVLLVKLVERKLRGLATSLGAFSFARRLVNGLFRRNLSGSCLVNLIIARDAARRLRRHGMMHRTAHGAGRTVLQIRCKQTRATRALGLLQLLHLRQVLIMNGLRSFEPLNSTTMRLSHRLSRLLQFATTLHRPESILLGPHSAFERGARFAERNVRAGERLTCRLGLRNRILRFALGGNQQLFLLQQGLHLLLSLLRRRNLGCKVFCGRERLARSVHAHLRRIGRRLCLCLANVRSRKLLHGLRRLHPLLFRLAGGCLRCLGSLLGTQQRFLCGRNRLVSALQGLIFRERPLDYHRALGYLQALGIVCAFLLQRRLQPFRPPLVLNDFLGKRRTFPLVARTILHLLHQRVCVGPFTTQLLNLLVQLLGLRLVASHKPLEQLDQPCSHGRPTATTLVKLLLARILRRKADGLRATQNVAFQLLVLALEFAALLAQAILQHLVLLRGEQLAENALARCRVGREQLAELPLRQHDDLLELVRINTQQLFHLHVHLANAADAAPIGQLDFSVRRLFRGAFAALLSPLVIGIALYTIGLPAVRELQLNERFACRIGEIAAQTCRRTGAVSAIAACLAEQSEANGVEDHGFACACIAAHQVHARAPKRPKVDFRLAGIRSEGGHGQLQRLHCAPSSCPSGPFAAESSTFAISLRAKPRCSSSRGLPTWLS